MVTANEAWCRAVDTIMRFSEHSRLVTLALKLLFLFQFLHSSTYKLPRNIPKTVEKYFGHVYSCPHKLTWNKVDKIVLTNETSADRNGELCSNRIWKATTVNKKYKKASIRSQYSAPPRAPNGVRSLCVQISRERSYPWQHIDTTRKAIDCATTLPLKVFI